jgi:hypothetical protein
MKFKLVILAGAALIAAGFAAPSMAAQKKQVITPAAASAQAETFSSDEIVGKGHQFFGKTTRGLAKAVEYSFQKLGEPTAYIVGEEGSGAIIGGLRYGEGTIYYKDGTKRRIFWQGPSIGFDFGGNGSRSLVLVYNSSSPRELDGNRFVGVEGSAYLVGGLGVNFQKYADITLAPIRTGVGARIGANVGYLKYSKQPDWNPF